MLRYALRRFVGLLATLIVIVTLSFAIVRLAPGGPFDQEQPLAPAVRANLERHYGFDKPLGAQYVNYLARLAHGDFGPSLRQRDFSVTELIAQGLPVSALIGLLALALALLTGIPAGIAAAVSRGSALRVTVGATSALALALPAFVVGPLLALVCGLWLHLLPVAGYEPGGVRYLVLPVTTLALPVAAHLARLTYFSLREVLGSGFVRSARARGIGSARVLLVHALPPALLPVLSYLGPAVAFVVTGSLVVESVFGIPGTGRFLVEGAIERDYPLVLGMVIVYGALTLLFNLLVDLAYGYLDPGVRHE
jgi:oligopeptide transport system permease protein